MAKRLVGSGGDLYRVSLDADFREGSEPAVVPSLLTHPFYPMGESGDCVFRRVYVVLTYEAGISVTLTPIIDGTALDGEFISLPGAGRVERWISLVKRGGAFQLRVEGAVPEGGWAVERCVVHFHPAQRAKV